MVVETNLLHSLGLLEDMKIHVNDTHQVVPALSAAGAGAALEVDAVSAAAAGVPAAVVGGVGVVPPWSAAATGVGVVGVALDDDRAAASAGASTLAVVVGDAAGVAVPLEGDPDADVVDGVPVVVVVGAAGTSAGSVSGGRVGRAVQNHPMICMPGQLRVPELAS